MIELRQPDGSVATYEAAPGKGWSVTQGKTTFWGALGDGDTMLWLRMQEGGDWLFGLRGGELAPADASAGLGLRITLGSLRLCADFGADTVVRNGVRRVVARDAPRASGYRCDFAAE